MFFRKCFSCRTFIISTDLERYWRWLGNGCCRFHSVRQHFSILRMKLHKLSISLNNYDHYESTRRDWIDLKWQNVNYFWFQYFIRSKPFTNGCCVCKSQNHNLWQKKQEKKITVYWKTADYIIPAKCLIFVERIRRSMFHNLIRITVICSFVIDCGMYASE